MVESTSILPLIITSLPMAGSLLVWIMRKYSERLRDYTVIGTATLTLLLMLLLFSKVINGNVFFQLPWFLGFGLVYDVDFIGGLFALVVAIVWFLATIFAREYMALERNQTRFYIFFIFTLGATLGVFLAGDLFSLFLFFELMTFAAYVLVIHEQDSAAIEAGNVYLYMSVIGGLCLLAVIFLLQHLTGSTGFQPALDYIVAAGFNPWVVLFLVIGGFGVKAGMIPLHIWLPKAHPVAPSPASALLSALMIKAGAYGFIRFLLTVLTPIADQSLWSYSQAFGYLFLIIGAVTMVGGGLMALINSSMKRILAYSSISQMGYILYSLGIAGFMGELGAMGMAGAWIHILNHAFYKSFLFLLVGAIYMQTRELDINNLGGLRHKMPWVFGFMLVAAAGITGVPGFNGYLSKVIIHGAILEAMAVHDLPRLIWLERIFVITGGLTVAYITKLWISIFGGKLAQRWNFLTDISKTHKWVLGIYALIITFLGVFAQATINKLVLPVLETFNFRASSVGELTRIPFWDIHELASPVIAYLIGLSLLLIIGKLNLQFRFPKWLSIEYLVYQPLTFLVLKVITMIGGAQIPAPNLNRLAKQMENLKAIRLPRIELNINRPKLQIRRYFDPRLYERKINDYRDSIQKRLQRVGQYRIRKLKQDRTQRQPHFWDTRSFSLDSLIVALIIALLLLAFIGTYFS